MSLGFQKDIGAFVHHVIASVPQASQDLGATGAVTNITGLQVDRNSLPREYNSVTVAVPFRTVLDTGLSFTLGAHLQDRSSTSGAGSTWANFGTTGRTLVVTNATTSTDVAANSLFKLSQTITGASRYLRTVVTKVPSSTATGVGSIHVGCAVLTFGGADRLPASG